MFAIYIYVIQRITSLDKVILRNRSVIVLDQIKASTLTRNNLSKSKTSPYPDKKINHIVKSKSNPLFIIFLLVTFSIYALITTVGLSFEPGIYIPVVMAQELNQSKINASDLIRNNNNDNVSAYDIDKSLKNNNVTTDKNTLPNRLITLVTEDTFIDIAPGERVKAWTFNGTVPGPTIRLTEGENVTIKYINKSPIPHTIHFHGNHDDINDGVIPQVLPGQTYLYNITGEPAGALMYHCHAPPTSMHIRMGMYGALIVDPLEKQITPAKEFVMVMGEYSLKNQMEFEADYYMINGYADQYVHNPLVINQDDLMRIYLINLGTTIPASFHLHSTTFLTYPSGLWANNPIHSQTVSVAPGDASIVEAKWKYPGNYFFHTHGIQEEKGNMGQIKVIGQDEISKAIVAETGVTYHDLIQGNNVSKPLTKSISMFDWQYELQKKLQNPKVVTPSEHKGIDREEKKIIKEMDETMKLQGHDEDQSLSEDKTFANLTNGKDSNSNLTSVNQISIVSGSSNPDNMLFYDPSPVEVKPGTEVTWINNDSSMPHTVTSGSAEKGSTGEYDSGIIYGGGGLFSYKFDKKGDYEYYCTLHPWMTGKITVK